MHRLWKSRPINDELPRSSGWAFQSAFIQQLSSSFSDEYPAAGRLSRRVPIVDVVYLRIYQRLLASQTFASYYIFTYYPCSEWWTVNRVSSSKRFSAIRTTHLSCFYFAPIGRLVQVCYFGRRLFCLTVGMRVVICVQFLTLQGRSCAQIHPGVFDKAKVLLATLVTFL